MLPSGLPEQIADGEDLARFLTQSSQFNTTMVKPSAFLPNPNDHETSVFRHGREPSLQLWDIGREAAGATRKLYGAAIFKAKSVRAAHVEVHADEPPLRHAVIHGWPWMENDPELQKAKQKEIAALIASEAGCMSVNVGL